MKHHINNILIIFTIFLVTSICLNLQPGYSQNISKPFLNNSTILPGYINCLIQYNTSQCRECPPNCITFESDNFIVNNKDLANNIDKIFEKSLRQLSIIKSFGENDSKAKSAIIYLNSLLLKNSINPAELKILSSIVEEIYNTNSTITLGKNIKEILGQVSSNNNSSSVALAIVHIASKSVDLLINSDSIVHKVPSYPNLPYNLTEQKEWVLDIIISSIIGCEISGILGCFMSPIIAAGII